MNKWKCTVCGYVYDPAEGDVGNGIAAGTSLWGTPERVDMSRLRRWNGDV